MGFVVELIFILCVTAVVIVAILTRSKTRGSHGPQKSGDLNEKVRQLGEQLQAIDQRLKNVETITTSKAFHLEDEFENLKKKG